MIIHPPVITQVCPIPLSLNNLHLLDDLSPLWSRPFLFFWCRRFGWSVLAREVSSTEIPIIPIARVPHKTSFGALQFIHSTQGLNFHPSSLLRRVATDRRFGHAAIQGTSTAPLRNASEKSQGASYNSTERNSMPSMTTLCVCAAEKW